MSREESRGSIVRRRLVSIPAVVLGAVVLLLLLPIWLPIALIVDLVTDHRRLPRTRLLLFALCWTWLETAALVRLGWIWVTGGAHDLERMTAAQRWWASGLLGALRLTTGLRVKVEGVEAFDPAPAVILARHACLADSLVSAWVVVGPADHHVRFVIKRELLSDPCLDVAGNRLRNHFVDRGATDSGPELDALRALTTDMGDDTCAVIFPEGARANPDKRARALARIAERDPARAVRLGALEHLNPPRPAGSEALLAGAPDADVVVAWHTGFDGMDTFGGILRNLPPLSGRTIRYVARRVPRAEVPSGEAFTRWLDDTWLQLDREIDATLADERVVVSDAATALVVAAAAVAALMFVTWLVSVALKDASIVDPVWGFGFVLVAWVVLLSVDGDAARQWLLVAMTTVWGLRLAGYLAWRKRGTDEDFRYQAFRKRYGARFWWVSAFTVFGLQGLLMWVVSLPVQLGQVPDDPGLGVLAGIGVAVWAVGLFFEVVGDAQLARFKADPANAGTVMDRGLWRYTRHPNYFGDACVWWGIALVAAESGLGAIGIVGAVVMTVLLRRVSGVTLLERSLTKRRVGYDDYIARTSPFVPRPPR